MSYQKAMALISQGPSRPTLFAVRLPREKVGGSAGEYLEFFCKSTAIPEVRTNTIAVGGHENMGIVREQATNIMFGKPFNMEVIETSDLLVYKSIRGWFDTIAQGANQEDGARSQRMRYYDTYKADFELVKLEYGGPSLGGFTDYREVMKVKFIGGYPITVNQIGLAADSNDTATTFSVDFTYESYSVSYDALGSLSVPGEILGAVGGFVGGRAGDVISTFGSVL